MKLIICLVLATTLFDKLLMYASLLLFAYMINFMATNILP